jgi:hypothetical protein
VAAVQRLGTGRWVRASLAGLVAGWVGPVGRPIFFLLFYFSLLIEKAFEHLKIIEKI